VANTFQMDQAHRAVLPYAAITLMAVFSALGQSVSEKKQQPATTNDPIAQTFYRFASARPTNDLKALAACITGLQPHWDRAKVSAIHTPILVVAGDRDELAPDAPELVELIPSSRLVVIPGRDHMGAVPAREFKHAAIDFLSAE